MVRPHFLIRVLTVWENSSFERVLLASVKQIGENDYIQILSKTV